MQITLYPQTLTSKEALEIMRADFGNPHVSTTAFEAVLLVEHLRFELNLGRYVRPQVANGTLTWDISDDKGTLEPDRPACSALALETALELGWVCMAGECLTITIPGLRYLDRLRLGAGFEAFEYEWVSELSDESYKAPHEWDLSVNDLARLRLLEALRYFERRSAFYLIDPVDETSIRIWGYTLQGPLGFPACDYPISVLYELQSHGHITIQGTSVRITEAGWSWFYFRTLKIDTAPVLEEEAIDWEYVLCRGKITAASFKALVRLKAMHQGNNPGASA